MAGPVVWPDEVLIAKREFSPSNPATTFFEQKLRKLLGQDEARCQDKLFYKLRFNCRLLAPVYEI